MEEKNEEQKTARAPRGYLLPLSILLSALSIAFAWIYAVGLKAERPPEQGSVAYRAGATGQSEKNQISASPEIELPASWGDLGVRMIEAGVIDRAQFEALYAGRGGVGDEERQLLLGSSNGRLIVTRENSGFVLNLLWALGLSNKNDVLEKGPMADPRYGDLSRFASTGGWTLAKGDVMYHYSKHPFITLTSREQELVLRVSKNIYRPCCDNATYLPDCNHGMAMLGLLELLASEGATEEQMYTAALQMNTFWFPDEYAAIERYLKSKGSSPLDTDPKEILGREYSSASGYRWIAALVPKIETGKAGSCGA